MKVAVLNHPSFGVVPEAQFREAEAASAGKATQIIRKFDPLFGMLKGDCGELKTFKIECSRMKRSREWAEFEVEAESKDQAEGLVNKMDWEVLNWCEDYGDEDTDDYQIEEIKEVK